MADLGFTELSMEPVVGAADDPAVLTAEDLEIVKEQYEILAKEMIKRKKEGRGFTFYHYMKNSVDVMHIPEKNVRIAGQNYIVPAVVLQMHFMQADLSEVFMNLDASFLENVWNVQL